MVASGARRRRPAHHARGHARRRSPVGPVDVDLLIMPEATPGDGRQWGPSTSTWSSRPRRCQVIATPCPRPSGATAIATATTRTDPRRWSWSSRPSTSPWSSRHGDRHGHDTHGPAPVELVIMPEATPGNACPRPSGATPRPETVASGARRRRPGHHARGAAGDRHAMPEATPGDGRQWSPSTSPCSSRPRPSGATAIATATTRTDPRRWSWSSRPSTSPWSSRPRPRPATVASGARRRRPAHHARGAAGDRHATPGDGRQWSPSTSPCSSRPRPAGATAVATATTRTDPRRWSWSSCPRPRPATHARGPRVPRHARRRSPVGPVDVDLVITPEALQVIATPRPRPRPATVASGARRRRPAHHARGHARRRSPVGPVDVDLVIMPEALQAIATPRPRPRPAMVASGARRRRPAHHARGHARRRSPVGPVDVDLLIMPEALQAIATPRPRPQPATHARGPRAPVRVRRRRPAHHARGAAGDRHATPEATPGDGRQWSPSTSTCSSRPRRCR